ncbi:hypothetical protein C2S51_025421 [Perilla frutescens var. frutescens]|nr:hypothetical protein C2S51_025421 [Perilla frutescens var. frutescens]
MIKRFQYSVPHDAPFLENEPSNSSTTPLQEDVLFTIEDEPLLNPASAPNDMQDPFSLSDLAQLMPTEETYSWLSNSMSAPQAPQITDNLLATYFSLLPQLSLPSHEFHQLTLLDDAKNGEENVDDGNRKDGLDDLTLWDQIQREVQLQVEATCLGEATFEGEVQLEQQEWRAQGLPIWTWENAQLEQKWGIHSIPHISLCRYERGESSKRRRN